MVAIYAAISEAEAIAQSYTRSRHSHRRIQVQSVRNPTNCQSLVRRLHTLAATLAPNVKAMVAWRHWRGHVPPPLTGPGGGLRASPPVVFLFHLVRYGKLKFGKSHPYLPLKVSVAFSKVSTFERLE